MNMRITMEYSRELKRHSTSNWGREWPSRGGLLATFRIGGSLPKGVLLAEALEPGGLHAQLDHGVEHLLVQNPIVSPTGSTPLG